MNKFKREKCPQCEKCTELDLKTSGPPADVEHPHQQGVQPQVRHIDG